EREAFTTQDDYDEPSLPRVRQGPSWRLTVPVGRPIAFPERDPHMISLSSWQREAIEAWYRHGCAGIVEAVTGSGKTRVALAAIGHQLREGRNVLVVVPSIVLQKQWFDELRRTFRGYEVHKLGDGAGVPRSGARLVVGVVNSCASHWDELGWIDTVVADECHNYGASTFRRALLPEADRRLGLTATLERLDDAVDDVLLPYFGGIVYRCDFRRAYRDGRIALARIALVGVNFDSDDASEYEEVCETL